MHMFMYVLESPQCTPGQAGMGLFVPTVKHKIIFYLSALKTSPIRHLIQGQFSSNFKAAFHLKIALIKAFQAVLFKTTDNIIFKHMSLASKSLGYFYKIQKIVKLQIKQRVGAVFLYVT